MTIGKVRTALYKTARILGDVNAVLRGTIKKRIARRLLGRFAGKTIGRIVR